LDGNLGIIIREEVREEEREEGVERVVGMDKMPQEKMHRHNSIFRTEKKDLSHIDLYQKL
jgi:hypothetical protein